jgi:hypothetical protein
MAADWVRFCSRAEDLTVTEPHVDVKFGDGRRHRVTVKDEGDSYLIGGCVARQAVVTSVPDLPVRAWTRNRATQLVGFRIDRRQRLVGEAWLPKEGITREEFQLYLRRVAFECDRFEYLLSGRDAE